MNLQVGLQLGPSKIRFQGRLEAFEVILEEIRKLQNLSLAISNRLKLPALKARLQSCANLPFEFDQRRCSSGDAVYFITLSISSMGVKVSSPISVV